ncbi:hypothetical protein KY332_05045 [Candidatus Woesearchaeota archaeon]|nr:hypothetical protein [Candidatus Woesearchaeota archaeon]
MVKQGNDKFTISVNKRIKEAFKKICEEEGLKPGKQIEKFMLDFVRR